MSIEPPENWPFKPDGSITNNIDLHIRPYSATLERKVAFDLGPIAKHDTSEGLKAYTWRARVESGIVYLCRENDAGDGWQAEEQEFVADETGEAIIREISLTFDQNARPTIAYKEGAAIKLWWFDPTIEDNSILTITSEGRNPQIYLDDRETAFVGDSDMLLFLVQESTDRMYYVRQRDRYDTAYELPVDNVKNKFLELVTMGLDRRLYIFYTDYAIGCETIRVGTDTLHVGVVRTGLYPIPMEHVELQIGPDEILSGSIREIIHKTSIQPEVEIGPDEILSASIAVKMHENTIDLTELEIGPDEILSASIAVKIHTDDTMLDNPVNVEIGPDEIISAAIRAAIIEKTIEIEKVEMGPDEILSASISVP